MIGESKRDSIFKGITTVLLNKIIKSMFIWVNPTLKSFLWKVAYINSNLKYLELRIERAKQGLGFNLSVLDFFCMCKCLYVCLSHDYGHKSLLIFMKFGSNVIGKRVEERIVKDFFLPSVSKWRSFLGLFHSYGRRVKSTVHRTNSY